MFLKKSTSTSTEAYWDSIKKLRSALDCAAAVVIGAGAGLSASAGFEYSGERFERYFADFRKKYGFADMYSGGFYPYKTPEEYWAYWSRYIMCNRYEDAPKPIYNELFETVKDKDYFVITTNVDHCFQKAGFDKNRLFYTQGDFGLFQCSVPCCGETFNNEAIVRQMVEEQRDMRIPSELVPRCPNCGRPMMPNLRADDRFVEDKGWNEAFGRYKAFIDSRGDGSILFLELGVGYNTPVIIKYPFWRMTARNPEAVYACVNFTDARCPQEIEKQSVCIGGNIGRVLSDLRWQAQKRRMSFASNDGRKDAITGK